MTHLPILPLLAPFATALLLLAWPDLAMTRRRQISVLALLVQLGLALLLVRAVADGEVLSYRLGAWPPPWGIVLVADRLAAGMVLITALLALVALLHVGDGTDRRGRHFHVLFQFQLFGLYGAFLTGDLFNLFVFFEVLLIASYGLLLHGGGAARVAAGLHYVVLNLLGSAVFLIAAGLLYGALGSLNMADLAVRAGALAAENLGLARSGGLLLFAAFALKAALVPLHLWLPAAYAGTAAPVAALFAVMTKLGAYAILRADSLFFGPTAGPLAGLYDGWLLPLGLLTLFVGSLGALAAATLGRLAAYLVVSSAGTLLIAWSLGPDGVAAGLYYLPHGTFAAAALFLVAEAMRRRRTGADRLVADADLPRHGLWGACFFVAAIAAAGLPPLSGFVGKFLLLRAAGGSPLVWWAILAAAFCALLALARAGSRLFLAVRSETEAPLPARPDEAGAPSALGVTALVPEAAPSFGREVGAVAALLLLIGLLTAGAGPASAYARATAMQLADPAAYIAAVLGTEARPKVGGAPENRPGGMR